MVSCDDRFPCSSVQAQPNSFHELLVCLIDAVSVVFGWEKEHAFTEVGHLPGLALSTDYLHRG